MCTGRADARAGERGMSGPSEPDLKGSRGGLGEVVAGPAVPRTVLFRWAAADRVGWK